MDLRFDALHQLPAQAGQAHVEGFGGGARFLGQFLHLHPLGVGEGDELALLLRQRLQTRRERVVLGEKTSTTWFSGDDEDADEEVDIEIIIRDFDDPEAGENLRRFMESPSLNINGFNYFPNPNDGKFRLRFDLPDPGDLKIRVYSPEGKVLYEEFKQGFSGGYNQEIDLSEFVSEGVYFLQLTQNGKGMADKIIVR